MDAPPKDELDPGLGELLVLLGVEELKEEDVEEDPAGEDEAGEEGEDSSWSILVKSALASGVGKSEMDLPTNLRALA